MLIDLLNDKKKIIRKQVLIRRRGLDKAFIGEVSTLINQIIFSWPLYQQAKSLMCFLSMSDEPQTDDLILNAINSGKKVSVPSMRQQEFGVMDAVAIDGFDDLTTGRLGLRVPRENKQLVAPQDIELILVPGVSFDRHGNRLGMGAGYYDRFLAQATNATLVGVVWNFQILDDIPAIEHDIPMHFILTEQGIMKCSLQH
jgi:5-formyltetrahydrofolate cyclo-ligase